MKTSRRRGLRIAENKQRDYSLEAKRVKYCIDCGKPTHTNNEEKLCMFCQKCCDLDG